jgi:hypothetical protein
MAPIVRPPCNPAGRQAQVCRGRTGSSGDEQEARLGRRAGPLKFAQDGSRPFKEGPRSRSRGPSSLAGKRLAPFPGDRRARDERAVRCGQSAVWPPRADSLPSESVLLPSSPRKVRVHAHLGRSFSVLLPTRSTSPALPGGSVAPRLRRGGRFCGRPCRGRRRRGTSTLRRPRSCPGAGRLPPGRGG